MSDPNLGFVLESAVRMLSELDHDPASVPESRRVAAEWDALHPTLSSHLLVNRTPGARSVEYDLLLTDPGGSTIALSVSADDRSPWSVSFADHWAANFVVTINDQNVTIQQVLREIALTQTNFPHMMTQIVDHILEAQALQPGEESVSSAEIQREVDAFRRFHGLLTSAETVEWLKAHAMTKPELGQLAASLILAKRIRTRISDARLGAEFAEHKTDYERMTTAMARLRSEGAANDLTRRAHQVGVLAAAEEALMAAEADVIDATVATNYASELQPLVRMGRAGQVIGPFLDGNCWVVAQVHRRESAVLDLETIERVRGNVLEVWLRERRAAAAITWHWN